MGEYQPERFLRYVDAAKINAGIESDAELARRMGKKQTPISMWRRHGAQPTPELLDILAEVLGVPARNLYILAGRNVPGDTDEVNERLLPREIKELIALYEESADDERAQLLQATRMQVAGLRALFGRRATAGARQRAG